MDSRAFMELLKAVFPERTLPYLAVALLSFGAAFVLFRMRYQGVIEQLEHRIKLKDEQIALKDDAIASESARAPRTTSASLPEQTASQQSAPLSKPTQLPRQVTDNPRRFDRLNAKILADMHNKLTTTRYKFVFNPESGAHKVLTFNPDGGIGEGKNDNESSWREAEGRLEILNSRGKVYSRFFFLPDGKLHHTNDPDTMSIKGQYLQPL